MEKEEEKYFEKEEDSDIDIPKEKRKLETASYDYSVDYLYNLMLNKKIILEVPFQRKFIWKEDRTSQLIESIIMNVPIPPIYFAEEEDGNWLVIDGLQRLSSIKRYFENEYGLKKLEIVKELEDLKFKDLPPKPKNMLKDGLLRVNVIKQASHPDIKYDIFMRLNKGAVNLNDQELRNCLYRGNLNELAKELAGDKRFLEMLGLKKPHPRFIDVEFILRYFAFSENIKKNSDYYIDNYSGSLKSFISNFLDANKNSPKEKLAELRKKFEISLNNVLTVVKPKEAFRDPNSKSKRVNKAIADCILLAIENIDIKTVENKKKEIYAKMLSILKTDKFNDSLRKRTADKTNLNYRINVMKKGIEDVVKL